MLYNNKFSGRFVKMSEIFEVLQFSNNNMRSKSEKEQRLEVLIQRLKQSISGLSEENRILKEKLFSSNKYIKELSIKAILQCKLLLKSQEDIEDFKNEIQKMKETISKLEKQIEEHKNSSADQKLEPIKNKQTELKKQYSKSTIEKQDEYRIWQKVRDVQSQRIAVVFDDDQHEELQRKMLSNMEKEQELTTPDRMTIKKSSYSIEVQIETHIMNLLIQQANLNRSVEKSKPKKDEKQINNKIKISKQKMAKDLEKEKERLKKYIDTIKINLGTNIESQWFIGRIIQNIFG